MKVEFKDLKALKFAPSEKTYMVSLLNSQEFLDVLFRVVRLGVTSYSPKGEVVETLSIASGSVVRQAFPEGE